MTPISRRRFLVLSGGIVVTGCTASGRGSSTTTVPSPATTSTVTTIAGPDRSARVLVLVQLNGGNDGLNTLVPTDGRYRDARPILGVAETELLASTAFPGYGLHPALQPVVTLADAGRIAAVQSIGFPEPNRSHFVSMARWWRADRPEPGIGWLGRWLDAADGDLGPLGAVVLGGPPQVLIGDDRVPTVITDAKAFGIPSRIGHSTLRALGDPISSDPATAAVQAAFERAVAAVEGFEAIFDTGDGDTDLDDTVDERGPITAGLAIAAEVIAKAPGTRVVVVNAGGFDTHANQAADQNSLLTDLATGLAAFSSALDASGDADRVLLATTSEFGRRVAENGSGGTDHGAAGLSLVLGNSIVSGIHGEIDWDHLIDGDLPPTIAPQALFTRCLDWIDGDAAHVLGQRDDSLDLLKP